MDARPFPSTTASLERSRFMSRVYGWMALALLISAAVSIGTASSPGMVRAIFGNRILFYALIFGELGLVLWLSAGIARMSVATAQAVFVVYSAMNGLTLSVIFLLYTAESIATTFLVTAASFGALSAYGYATKRDLTGFGSFLFIGLVGILIASLVNLFLRSEMVYWVTTYIGVFVFAGLTAYDTQKIKAMADSGDDGRGAIMGALALYLDFINLFLMLLRLLGGRRD